MRRQPMFYHSTTSPGERYSVIVKVIGWILTVIGSLVVLAWFFDVEVGKRIMPGFESMKFNTAVCFIACGIILWRKSYTITTAFKDPPTTLLSGFVVLISGLTLLQYWLGWQLGIDNLIVDDTETAAADWPGRMSVSTALCFSMFGVAGLITVSTSRYATLIWQLLAIGLIIVGG